MRSAYPVSGQRLCLAKSLQVSPEVQGGGRHTSGTPLLLPGLSLQEGRVGGRPREWRRHPVSWVSFLCPHNLARPTQELGSWLPPPFSPPPPPHSSWREPAVPQGIGAGTNGSADYRCLLIKEPNPFVFPAPILGSLEVQRARSWPGERYQGRDSFSSGHWGWTKFGF